MAQHCGGTPGVLAKWNFNTETIQCYGAEQNAPTPITNPSITPGATYCPNINNGCAGPVLGSVGHQNTPQYQNAVCLANFYNVEAILARGLGAPYNPNATSFDPEGKANLSVWYNFPKNTSGCLSSFQLKVLQKQFNGTQLNFEKQGVAVKRNGVVIYSETQNITAANINGTPFSFNFTGPQFCSDGSEEVEFEVVFGLVHRLIGPAMPGTPGQTGYDDICVNGYCKTVSFGGIIPATCSAAGANNDAKVLIQNFASGDRYDYVQGETYTGSATYASGSTAIPPDGIIPNFPNPISATKYTFRVFQQNCYSDFTVTLEPKYCCIVPTGSQLAVIPATCTGTTANSDAQIKLFGVSGGTKAGISTGTTYSGPDFASASTLTGGEFIFADLPNPLVSQIYTIRVFVSETCYLDLQTTLFNKSCAVPCTPPNGVTLSSVKATCTGSAKNSDATVIVTNVNGGDRVSISPSITYSGPDYATAANLVNGSYTFTGINTPNGVQIYTVRVYNTSDGCYIDRTVEIADAECGSCRHPSAFVISAGPNLCEANGANNQSVFESCKTTGFIDLELTKSVSPSTGSTCAMSGTPFVWTLTIQNKGNMTATGVNVVDLIPAGLSVTATNTLKGAYYGGSGWDIGTLAANETATLTITTVALNAGTYTNCAYINKALPDNDPDSSPENTQTANEDDDACASITVTGANAPGIAKSFSSMQIKPNTPTRLTIKITNNETVPITLTSDFTDIFPSSPAQMVVASTPNVQVSAGITLPPSGITAVAGGTSVTLPNGTVLAPGLNQFSVDIVVPANGNYCNSIASGALKTGIGENCVSAEACIIANTAFQTPPIITKSMMPATISAGQTSTLSITIENRNGLPMTLNQNFVDKIPAGLTVNGAITSSCGGATLQNNNSEILLAAGTSIAANTVCTISVPVTASINGQYCNTIIMNSIYTTVGTDSELGNEEIAQACLMVQSNCTKPNAGKDSTLICTNGTVPVSVQLTASPTGGTWAVKAGNPTGATVNTSGAVSITNPDAQGKTFEFIYSKDGCSDTVKVIVPACSATCVKPVLSIGTPLCSGDGLYSVSFNSSSSAVTATSGTISGNRVINIPVGTNVTITANNGTGCFTSLTVQSPVSCPVAFGCTLPYLSIGQPICNGSNYSVVFAGNGTVTSSAGTVSGNSITGIPLGTDIIVTASNGADCQVKLEVKAPADCSNPCENPTVSVSLPTCEPNATTYSVVYITSPGTTIVPSVGTLTGAAITGIQSGTDLVITIKNNNCPDRTLTISGSLVTCSPPCPKPTLTIHSAPTCSQDKQTYSVTFSVTGNNGVLKANGVALIGNNPYVITMPSGTNLTITDSLSALCKHDTTITAPSCGCPVSAPVAAVPSVVACQGEGMPMLSVSVPSGVTANWYASQTSTTALKTNSLTYTPTTAGTYWAEAVIVGPQGCVSTTRTPITLSVVLASCVPVTLVKMKK